MSLRALHRSLVAAAALVAAFCLTASAFAQGVYYREIEKDGRIYVFSSGKRADQFEKSGEIGTAITRVAAGPNSETLVFENEDAINLYNFKHNLPGEYFEKPKEAPAANPLQFKIGGASITPIGFMDFTGVWRDKVGGSGIGTNFSSIPYGTTTYQTNLNELRLSMQNSRIGFRVDADVKNAHVMGYMEADFLGNNPGNVAVSSNSNTMRSRVYWVDVQGGQWEVLAGQTWSLATPGRSGISPLPGSLFYTQNIDVNYQAGLFWGRIPELRVVFHPSSMASIAIAADNPEQYIGGSAGGGTVTLPADLSTSYSSQLNTGGNTLGVPNQAPDFIGKIALDPSSRFHIEAGGLVRSFKVYDPSNSTNYSTTGGGGFANVNIELAKGFRIVSANLFGSGIGRYIFGQAPDVIAHADGSLSAVKATATVDGLELTIKNTLLYAYYGGQFVTANTATDTNGKSIGYGYTGAPTGQNKKLQEYTAGFAQTFWKDGKYGALTLMGQYSYLVRTPFSVASGQPADAKINMVFFNLRYTLPGSAPPSGK